MNMPIAPAMSEEQLQNTGLVFQFNPMILTNTDRVLLFGVHSQEVNSRAPTQNDQKMIKGGDRHVENLGDASDKMFEKFVKVLETIAE